MNKWHMILTVSLSAVAHPVLAGTRVGVPTGRPVSVEVGNLVGFVVPIDVGSAMPMGLGGMAAIAGLSLIIGVQLAKRRRK